MKRLLPLVLVLAGVALVLARVSAQRPVFTTGTPAELAEARSIGLDRLRAIALPKGIEDANDLLVSNAHVDRLSMAHVRVQQRFQGIPVLGGEAIAHLNADGSRFAETDNLVVAINVSTTPTLTASAAIDVAVTDYGCRSCLTRTPTADLWIVRDDAGVDHLTYRVQLVRLDGTNQTALPVRFVDAHGGYVVLAYDNLQTATGSSLYSGDVTIGTSYSANLQQYVMENLTRRVGTFDRRNTTTGTLFRFLDPDDIWNDSTQRAAVDAQYATERFVQYLQTVHGHNGLDGSGGPFFMAAHDGSGGLISAGVHYGLNYNNAFWDTTNKFASFGDGDGSDFSPLVTLDIVGHELMHGVTQATANLVYRDESGALNESWSDVFGALLERYVQGESANTWLNGEQAYTPGLDGDALRYLDNPHQAVNKGFTSDDDPDHYSERFICDDEPQFCDNGGVHINSGIANKAFYLLAQGGTHHRGGSMTGIGADASAQIWFTALTSYMTSNSSFFDARQATTLAAEALYGSDSTEKWAVARAWCLVGVGTCVTVEAISASPNAGAGTAQAFTLQYSDTAGAIDLKSRVRFASASNQGAGSCSLAYSPYTETIQLMDDGGIWGPAVPLGSGALANSQCVVNLASSTATPSGNTLTLVLNITFSGTFSGMKNIYMLASSTSTGLNTGWVQRGTWTGSGVAAVSASPSGGAALRQAFTLQYDDTQGASDIVAARVRFGISNVSGCSARYNATNGSIGLLNDAGSVWTDATMGNGVLANSQCTLNLASSTATLNGTALTVVLDITFSPSFSGLKPIYMLAKSVGGATTDWQQRATWTVPPFGPAAISVTPGSGTGLTQAFTLRYSDSAGAASLTSARVRFGASNVGPGTCTARYNAMTGAIQLLDDAGSTWTTGTLGGGTLSNSQCTLDLSGSAATLSGTDLTLVLNITFSVAFAGQKNIYLLAADIGGASTGWQQHGTWTIPVPVVEVTSVSPNVGAGTTRAFTLQYSDTFGGFDLSSARVRFATSNVGPGSCTARFNAGAGTIELLDDAGTSWLPGTLGSGSLANSQCTLNLSSSAGTVDDNDATVVLNITFASNFIGLKNIYMLAGNSSGQTSGWLIKGSWTPHLDPNSQTAVDLGTLGGANSEARAVNMSGQTVGVGLLPNGDSHAFSWSPATGMVDLGTFGGRNSDALAVNASGQVVGWSLPAPAGQHAFLWTLSGGMVDIDARASGYSRANAISANGQIVGSWDGNPAHQTHAFLWTQAGGMVDLGTLGGQTSTAVAVNDNGQVVGYSQVTGSQFSHAFSWTAAGGMIDLGTFGGVESRAFAVSASGEVVGYAATPSGVYRAFSWTQSGGKVDLGNSVGGSESRAFAVNDSGQIVGVATLINGSPRGFSWTPSDGMVDLGTHGAAVAVNAHGQVVGTNGVVNHGFSWTPAGGLVDLGTLPGGYFSSATAVNDHCQVVGQSAILGGGFAIHHAVLWNVGPCPTIQATSSR